MANNPYVNKVVFGGVAIVDITPTTAVESDVASGKVFFKADGSMATGTKTDAGVSIVTTQDTHGGDIITITGTPVVPYNWIGEEAELLETYDMGTTALADTLYNGWTPSTSAKTIKATSNLGTKALSMANYEYFIKWLADCKTVYNDGTTLKAAVVRQCFEITQAIYRKPSNLTNLASGTDSQNNCTTLYTAPLMDYYNTSGSRALTWTGSYGIYIVATGSTFSSSTSNSPTLTIKAPTYNARCNTSYFATGMASAVNQAASTITCKGYLYRSKKGAAMYHMYRDVVDLYNS